MLFMYKIGFARIDTFRNNRRMIWFLLAVFAAVITPSVDVYGMLFLWVPLCILFEFGIWLCLLYPPPVYKDDEDEWSESEEVIEV
jgi:Sec-independent protein secretion pathway component TatC